MLSRTHFFLLTVAVTTAYGFYIITTDEDSVLRYPEIGPFEGPSGGFETEGFVPKLSLQSLAVLDEDDLDYLDRVNRLQRALKVKRSVIDEANAFSQNIRPIDLDGMKLVRAPIVEVVESNDYERNLPKSVTKRDTPYVVVH
ncbi:hypothetical protein FO519_003863 [Halicephalobus sp. NKZ332]|nr:hypothetical protein FO519_003863 [Halicephalobus sp. NKZ332]